VSNQKKWFFLKNNEVTGPFTESEINPLAAGSPEALIWGQGMSEWVSHAEWRKSLDHLQDVLKGLQSDMTPSWLLKYNDITQGPYIYDQLVMALKAHPAPSEVLIKTNPESQWQGIYDFPPLVEEIGLTRRQHNRAPISGIFKFEKNGQTHEALLGSISQGGIGILEAQGISVGDVLKGEIQSHQLPTSINCQCEVLYFQQEDGNWGLRFINLPAESMSLVVEYTRRFQP